MKKLLVIIGMVALLMIILLINCDSAFAQENKDPKLYLYTDGENHNLKTTKPEGDSYEAIQVHTPGNEQDAWHLIRRWQVNPLEKSININGEINFEIYLANDGLTGGADIEMKVGFFHNSWDNELTNGTDGPKEVANNEKVTFSGSMSIENLEVKNEEIFGINVYYRFPESTPQTYPSTQIEMRYESDNYDARITIPCNDYITIEVNIDDHPNDEYADIIGTIEDAFGSEDIKNGDDDYSIRISGEDIESDMSEDHKTVSGTWNYKNKESGTYSAVVKIKDQNNYEWEESKEFSITKGESDIKLKPLDTSKNCDPSESVKYSVTVKNEGTRKDTIKLALKEKPENWKVTINDEVEISITLDESDERIVSVEVEVPKGTQVKSYNIKIIATSSLDQKTVTTTIETVVNSVYGVELECKQAKKTLSPGKSVVYELTVKNIGNDDDEIIIEKSPSSWVNSFSEDQFNLVYGESNNITFTVEAPNNVKEGDKATITVTARSRGDSHIDARKTIIAEIQYNIIISSDKKTETIKQGEDFTFTLKIQNLGTEGATVNLEVNDFYSDWVNFEADSVTIGAEESTEIKLKIDVPSDAKVGTHKITIVGKEDENIITPELELKIKVEEEDKGIEAYYLPLAIAASSIIVVSLVFVARGVRKEEYEEEEEEEEEKREEKKEKAKKKTREKKEKKRKEKETSKLKDVEPPSREISKKAQKPPGEPRTTRAARIPPRPPGTIPQQQSMRQPYRPQVSQQPLRQPYGPQQTSMQQQYRPQQGVAQQQAWKKPQTKIRGVGITQQLPQQPMSTRAPVKPRQREIPVITGTVPKPQTPPPMPETRIAPTPKPQPPISETRVAPAPKPQAPAIGPPLPKKKKFGKKKKKELPPGLDKKEAKALKKKEKEEKKKLKKIKKKKKGEPPKKAPTVLEEETYAVVEEEGIAVVEEEEEYAVVEEAVEVVEEEEEEEVYAVVEEE